MLAVSWLAPVAAADGAAPAAATPQASPLVDRALLLGFLADPSTLTLIDARSPEEFAARHVGGAINIPHDRLEEFADRLPADPAEPIVIYCKSGQRAGLLRAQLAARGYRDVQVLPPRQLFWTDEVMVFNCGLADDEQPVPVAATIDADPSSAAGAKNR